MELMTVRQFAAYVGVSYNTILDGCKNGKIPFYLFGKKKRMIDPAQAMPAMQGEPKTPQVPPQMKARQKHYKGVDAQTDYQKKIAAMIRAAALKGV